MHLPLFQEKKPKNYESAAASQLVIRRQWDAEKDTTPLPSIHPIPSDFAIAYSRLAIVLTIVFWFMYILSVVIRQLIDGPQSYNFTLEAFGYALTVTFLNLSALMYLIAWQGALQRFKKHVRVPQWKLDEHFAHNPVSITVLVPSYSEEIAVIRKTLLSAALQEFQKIRVVLLVDDKPYPTDPLQIERLTATRKLPHVITDLLSEPYTKAKTLQARLVSHKNTTVSAIIDVYEWSADWLDTLATAEVIEDHVDVFFAEQVLRALATDLRQVVESVCHEQAAGVIYSTERLAQLVSRLVSIFGVEMDIFERKQYLSLSHEANKAMNLNSYVGLMGGMYRVVTTSDGQVLEAVTNGETADLVIPDTEYVLTLDADSILLREYCARLVYFLTQPDNQDVAVVQTPYSSFRGASSRLERLSGATTDIQHIIHQGMSYYNATFWVGANAVIRKRSLEDIVEHEYVGGFLIKRYVQDRTVIEDTESSIDLAQHNWRLVNYPERLSYSATPPDFGSLAVQRQRWANGGLLIFPKLMRLCHLRKHQNKPIPRIEFLIRTNYMVSIAWSNIGLVFLLAYPYDGRLLSPLVLLAAAPYFIAMAMDLKYCRYKYIDIVRIYGFNLILMPVNIAGTLKSLQQALTTKKIPFARTPKVKNRTATAWWYVVAPLLIVAFSLFTLWRNIEGENWGNAAFAGFNSFAASWAIVSYIGLRNMIVDVSLALIDWLYVEVPVRAASKQKSLFRFPILGKLSVGKNN